MFQVQVKVVHQQPQLQQQAHKQPQLLRLEQYEVIFSSVFKYKYVITILFIDCIWTDWIPVGNCTPSCGEAYRTETRTCYDTFTSSNCSAIECGNVSAVRNELCVASPPCERMFASFFRLQIDRS